MKKEIVAFRLERFYVIYYKSMLVFKGLKMCNDWSFLFKCKTLHTLVRSDRIPFV